MALRSDVQDIVDVLLISNINNLVGPNPVLVVPAGFGDFIDTQVVNNVGNLGLPSDVSQIVENFVLNNPNVLNTTSTPESNILTSNA